MPLKSEDFQLLDYRVVKINAERFVDPLKDDVGDGTTRSKLEAQVQMPESGPPYLASAEFTLRLEGFSPDDEGNEIPHFTANICAEFIYKTEREGVVDDNDLPSVVQSFALQACPLLVLKVRNIAHEMGFDGVDPDLGLRLDSQPQRQTPPVRHKKVSEKSTPRKRGAPRRTE
ncbi:hypothetical protein [Burkholderia pseudomultivorans]|uniref:hypothetical protein n=1 Tax=Burkholderia pseudomultivorans TaxID=1207504 RepID=UPI0012DA296B|nr:hypothetical protein [Burkholderia pseudomultivorans]